MSQSISLTNIVVSLHGKTILDHVSWTIHRDEQWVILGPNGSGKSTLVKALWGGVPVQRGEIVSELSQAEIGYVSFELHQHLMEYELLQTQLREYSGKIHEITTAEEVILSGIESFSADRPDNLLHLRGVLDRNITALSTGEMRRVLIARALMKRPKLLILDEPFDGLDVESRASLRQMIEEIMQSGIQLILINGKYLRIDRTKLD